MLDKGLHWFFKRLRPCLAAMSIDGGRQAVRRLGFHQK